MVLAAPYQKIFISNIQKNMKQKDGFVLREVCGEHVIVGEGLGAIDFGKLLALNETAAWLWKEAERQGDFTVDTLTAALCRAYNVTEEEAKADIAEVTEQWKQSGVLTD